MQDLPIRDLTQPGISFPGVFDCSVYHFGELRHVADEIFRGLDFEDGNRVVVGSIAIRLSPGEDFSDPF
ncbi:hypothetical protein GGP58_002611 [Salinibacter ruber]|uniref:hypothetical protein n=1 Tax=Salinibacter ruber TaxID=146919 RepID=UPI002168EAA3|nr:hypothetical protein [Salinibacter ruber]MCS3628735.1 hypothetical protein [Salinibacter ruber]